MTQSIRNAACTLALILSLTPALRADDPAATLSAARQTPSVLAVHRVMPATVSIHSEKRARPGEPLTAAGKKVNGMGTGIVIDERGYIVTNYHVVQDVDTLQVTLHDDTTYTARVVSFDSREDLAVIKITANRPLQVMPMGTSSDLQLAEDVIAVGNAFGYAHTITRGVISALGRNVEVTDEQAYRNLIQTDAAINPGNSGGPLINLDGDVIGINVAIRAGAQKIGFAIPIDDARKTIARLLDIERLNNNEHGLTARDEKQGAARKLVVTAVTNNSPAAVAGIQSGDVLVRSGDVSIIDAADFERSLLGRTPGESVPVIIRRNDAEQTVTLQIGRLGGPRSVAGRQQINNPVSTSNNSPSTTTAQRVPATTTTTVPATPVSTTVTTTSTGDRVWDVLGLRLSKLDAGHTTFDGQSYHGGMRIDEVRADSPAYKNGIRSGDVLVGLHVWETVTPDNVEYVLKHPQITTFSPLKFYILRERETLYGHFQIAAR
jgi:serine protease Do